MKLDRIAGYDFTFGVPKGVSLLYSLAGDERIVSAFRTAVDATMHEVELHMRTRVRAGGAMDDRLTKNCVYAVFVHRLARPENEIAEPHLHIHAVAMNLTRDHAEQAWKAGKFYDIKKHATYYERVFHSVLRREIQFLGYEVEDKGKFWDIGKMPQGMTEKYSSRTKEVGRAVKRDGVTDPKVAGSYGFRTRNEKSESVRGQDLRSAWDRKLSEVEKEWLHKAKPAGCSEAEFERLREKIVRAELPEAFAQSQFQSRVDLKADQPKASRSLSDIDRVEFEAPSKNLTRLTPSVSLRAVVRYTAARIFERVGVVTERDFVNEVLRSMPRAGTGVDEIRREMETLDVDRREIAATAVLVDPKALGEEKRLVEKVIAGRVQFAPLLRSSRAPEKISETIREAYQAIDLPPRLVPKSMSLI